MSLELGLTPRGHVVALAAADAPAANDSSSSAALRRVAKGFAAAQGEGLFVLAGLTPARDWPASLGYWRDFAGRYLAALCLTPPSEATELAPLPPPGEGDLSTLLLRAPPMPGAEYLSLDVFRACWQDLDAYVRGRVAESGRPLAEFLKEHAPLWHQVGRVCFHLAENRTDPDHPFAFLATYAPSLSGSGRVQYQPLSKALTQYAGAKDKPALVRLLSPVHLASQQSALVKELVESGDIYQPLAWTPAEAYRFLREVPLFEECGVLVRLPNWWKQRTRPRVSVSIGDRRQPSLAGEGLLDFNIHVALGDEELSADEWQRLLESDDGLVLLRGQWVEVDPERLQQALVHWKQVEREAADGLSFVEGMRLLAGAPRDLAEPNEREEAAREWAFVHAGDWLGDVLAKLRSPERAEPAGAHLKATLRGYQVTGVNWLRFIVGLGVGGCLADDMGLGKTIQVLGLLTALQAEALTPGPSPEYRRGETDALTPGPSPKGRGEKEAAPRPSLLVLPASLLANWKSEIERFAPTLRARFVHPSETPKEELEALAADSANVLRATDAVLTTYGMLARQPWLVDVAWRVVVLDEAQAIKNPSARQTKTVKRLKADARLALTGTPVENRLGDLWSLFDFLCPGLLGSAERFKKFAKGLGEQTTDRYAPLRRLVQPYILRRLKTDKRVIDDLPEKTEVRAYCGLSKRQAAIYAKLVEQLAAALKSAEGMKRRGLVLSYLMRFKQVCNHPSQLTGDGEFAPAESGKFGRLAEICDEIASRQERALVFTQFREMTEPLERALATVFGRRGLVLHGGTAVGKRKKLVDEFQREDGPPFFVLSLKAGGTGLNLTAASHVIHFDRWWNPAVENQATDRAFRIGQRRNVLVHKFVCRGTVEERIDAMIAEKLQLAADLLEGGGEQLLTEMSDRELLDFVSLDVNRASE